MKLRPYHKKHHSSMVALEIFGSVCVVTFVLFFAGVAQYDWTAPFHKTNNAIARASENQELQPHFFGDVQQQPAQRNFFKLAAVDPVSLSNLHDQTAPPLTAVSALVLDNASNLVLYEKKRDKRWPIASITKLVTASVLLDIKDKQGGVMPPVTIMPQDIREGRNFFEVNDVVAWDDLFNTMLTASSNTAAEALIRSSGLTQAQLHKAINQKLLYWGMQKTQVREVTGLSAGNISTAYEIASIFKRALERKEVKDALAQDRFTVEVLNTGKRVTVDTTNLFLLGVIKNTFSEADPIAKTGYIDESGFNMVALIQGPQGQELVVAVLGAAGHFERFTEIGTLAQWTFNTYSWEFKAR